MTDVFWRKSKLDRLLDGQKELKEIIMADAATFQADLDALKKSVEDAAARVIAAIQAAGPLTQAQLDAADAEVNAIKGEADAVAPAKP